GGGELGVSFQLVAPSAGDGVGLRLRRGNPRPCGRVRVAALDLPPGDFCSAAPGDSGLSGDVFRPLSVAVGSGRTGPGRLGVQTATMEGRTRGADCARRTLDRPDARLDLLERSVLGSGPKGRRSRHRPRRYSGRV